MTTGCLRMVLYWEWFGMGSMSRSMERLYVNRRYKTANTKQRHTYSLSNMQHRVYGAKTSRLIHWLQLIHHKNNIVLSHAV